MKRHPALIPVSREHHHLLVLAQVLKQDVPAYKNLPSTPEEQRDYAIEKYHTLMAPHMQWEEQHLLPLAEHYGEPLIHMAQQIREEHRALRGLISRLPEASGEALPQQLDFIGRLIAAHVRFEERRFFQQMQASLPETAWLALEWRGQEN